MVLIFWLGANAVKPHFAMIVGYVVLKKVAPF